MAAEEPVGQRGEWPMAERSGQLTRLTQVTMLTLDVVRRIMSKNNKDAASGLLDLSRANNFQLRSYNEGAAVRTALSGLIHVRQCENEREYFTRKVRKVVLSGNDLSARADIGGSLYELRVFRRSLESVVAVNCQLDSLGWAPDKEFLSLVELNLQHNYLTSIPELSCCPRLKRLILANNEISGVANLKKCSSTLEFLDLSSNHIRYSSLGDMKKDFAQISKLANLVEVKLEGNDFTLDFKDRYRQILVQILSESGPLRLKMLDGQSTDGIVALAATFTALDDSRTEEKAEETLQLQASSLRSGLMSFPEKRGIDPSLASKSRFAVLDHLLDQCLSATSQGSAKIMEALQLEANRLARPSSSIIRAEPEQLFASGETNVQLHMYEFLQKCVTLSERKKDMLEPLLRVLATLSRLSGNEDFTNEKKFGVACLRQLQDFMSANEETRSLVIKVINAELYAVPLSNLESVKSTVLPDLCTMAEEARCPELLLGAVKYLMSRLIQVVHSPGERALIFKVLSVASQDAREDGAQVELGAEGVADQLLQELAENSPGLDVRIWILQTIQNLCQPYVRHGKKIDSREFADYLATYKGFHRTLLLELSTTTTRNQAAAAEKPEQLTAAEIDTLSAMLRESRQAFADLCGAKDPQLFHVLAKYFLPKVPHLLAEAAAYRAIRCLLETTFCPISVREDDVGAPPRYKKDLLEDLQRIVLTNNTGNLLEYLREDSVLFADAWKVATRKLEGAPQFKELRDPKLHALFISIIDLIAAFNREAASNSEDGSWRIASVVAESMNTKGRESRLFSCLEIPSDVVRLAAVRCLNTVRLSEFEEDEIQHLVKMLQDVMNVSAGKTEEVIAISFNILTKLCIDDKRNLFQRGFGKTAVDACLRILEMNVSRDTRSMVSESEEKGVLTLACVRFLQAASKLETVSAYLESEPIATKADRILSIEDGFAGKIRFLASKTSANFLEHDPVLIETTAAGAQVEHLTRILLDVSLTGPVAPRLLRRVANLLMGIPDIIDLVKKVPEINQKVLASIRNAVRAEANQEKELADCWRTPGLGMFNEASEPRRVIQHEQFAASLCVDNLLERLERTVAGLLGDHIVEGGVGTKSDSKATHQTTSEATLPVLLERHLMVEQDAHERETEKELGGGLRIVPIELSRAEELEAQRDFNSMNEDDTEASLLDTLSAIARVLFGALTFGTPDTIASTQRSLRALARFRSIVRHFFGTTERPIYAKANLGAKFFAIAGAIIEMPPLRRFEALTEVRSLYSLIFACANRAMGLLHKRLLIHSRLAPGDDALIAAIMSCCTTASLQLEYVVDDRTGNECAPEELFRDLVPVSLIASAVRLLLYDMTLVRSKRFGNRNLFGELPEDDARENTIRFLSFCLRHSPNYRYAILEYLIRSNITDQFPVRRMLIQELMKYTHKLGSTQRAALEFRLKEDDEDEHQEVHDVPERSLGAAIKVATAVNNLKQAKLASDRAQVEKSEASSTWSIFQWCTGGDRLAKASMTSESDNGKKKNFDDMDESPAQAQDDVARPPNRAFPSDLAWDAVDVPSPPKFVDRAHTSHWQADRAGYKERVIAFSFVRWFEAGARIQQKDAYEHVIVLTTEKYMLFQVLNPEDAEYPKRWILLWRRPYRALVRVFLGVGVVHIVHRSSDSQSESNAAIATMLTPSRYSAKEIAVKLFRLNRSWRSVERSLSPALKARTLVTVEYAASEPLRRANFNQILEPVRSSERRVKDLTPTYIEQVHICMKKQAWEPVVAIFYHDVLYFVRKNWSDFVLANGKNQNASAPALVVKYELQALSKIKSDIRVQDFDKGSTGSLCASLFTPFPALVLQIGDEEVAVAFVDDLSRTVWRRLLG